MVSSNVLKVAKELKIDVILAYIRINAVDMNILRLFFMDEIRICVSESEEITRRIGECLYNEVE